MFYVQLLFLIIMVSALILFLGILMKNYKVYADYVQAVNKKDYTQKRLLPFGLYTLDKINYSFNSNYDRRILSSVCEVYGQEYSSFYIRVIYANKILLIAQLLICQLLAGFLSYFQPIFHFYVLLLFSILIMRDDIKLNKSVKNRRLEIQIEFPEFINKLTLLLNAGLTMSKAWEKISSESESEGSFYSEVSKTIQEIKSGKNESEAFSEFAKRVKTPEISRLMSSIIQNTKKGGKDLVLSMRLQSNECWEMRKNAVRRMGEEASTKLLFPMMIMFFAIIIIVITPALISMQGISSNF